MSVIRHELGILNDKLRRSQELIARAEQRAREHLRDLEEAQHLGIPMVFETIHLFDHQLSEDELKWYLESNHENNIHVSRWWGELGQRIGTLEEKAEAWRKEMLASQSVQTQQAQQSGGQIDRVEPVVVSNVTFWFIRFTFWVERKTYPSTLEEALELDRIDSDKTVIGDHTLTEDLARGVDGDIWREVTAVIDAFDQIRKGERPKESLDKGARVLYEEIAFERGAADEIIETMEHWHAQIIAKQSGDYAQTLRGLFRHCRTLPEHCHPTTSLTCFSFKHTSPTPGVGLSSLLKNTKKLRITDFL